MVENPTNFNVRRNEDRRFGIEVQADLDNDGIATRVDLRQSTFTEFVGARLGGSRVCSLTLDTQHADEGYVEVSLTAAESLKLKVGRDYEFCVIQTDQDGTRHSMFEGKFHCIGSLP